jgi:hypothetical protein
MTGLSSDISRQVIETTPRSNKLLHIKLKPGMELGMTTSNIAEFVALAKFRLSIETRLFQAVMRLMVEVEVVWVEDELVSIDRNCVGRLVIGIWRE